MKIDKFGYIKIMKLYLSKDSIKNVKEQDTQQGKITVVHIPKEDLFPEYIKSSYKSVRQSQTLRKNNQKMSTNILQKISKYPVNIHNGEELH